MSTDVVQQARVWCDKQQSYEPSYLSGPAVIACVRALAEMCSECMMCGGSGVESVPMDDKGTSAKVPCEICSHARAALAKLVNERSEA